MKLLLLLILALLAVGHCLHLEKAAESDVLPASTTFLQQLSPNRTPLNEKKLIKRSYISSPLLLSSPILSHSLPWYGGLSLGHGSLGLSHGLTLGHGLSLGHGSLGLSHGLTLGHGLNLGHGGWSTINVIGNHGLYGGWPLLYSGYGRHGIW